MLRAMATATSDANGLSAELRRTGSRGGDGGWMSRVWPCLEPFGTILGWRSVSALSDYNV